MISSDPKSHFPGVASELNWCDMVAVTLLTMFPCLGCFDIHNSVRLRVHFSYYLIAIQFPHDAETTHFRNAICHR